MGFGISNFWGCEPKEPSRPAPAPNSEGAVKLKLLDLGYNDYYGYTEMVDDFQRLCGISDGQRGLLIGEKTLKALDLALQAQKDGRSWKKAVAGMYNDFSSPDTAKLKELYAKLLKVKIEHSGLVIGYNPSPTLDLVKAAYSTLGFNVSNSADNQRLNNFIMANYQFQIISGANEERSQSAAYGKLTHAALLKAIKLAIEGKEWRASVSQP